MTMNRFQRLFIEDLKKMVAMWVEAQKRSVKHLLSLTDDPQASVPFYKVKEYTEQIDYAADRILDNVSSFKRAMEGEEERMCDSSDFDGYELTKDANHNCTNCNYCARALTMDPMTRKREERCYCSIDLINRDVKETNVCTSYKPQEEQDGEV